MVRSLLSRLPDLILSVSVTTRPPRPTERDGVDYTFVSDERFDELRDRGELLEWAEVAGHQYGTPAGPVDSARTFGSDVVLEIDIQGARQVRERAPDALLIFLTPPSLEELARRLRSRGTEDETGLARRMDTAEQELDERGRFDHVVVNDDVSRASAEVAAIIQASRTHD